MKKVLGHIANFINSRPLGMLGIIFAMRDIFLSVAFMVGTPEITNKLMYQGVVEIMSPIWFGVIFAIVSTGVLLAATFKRTKIVQIFLDLQAFIWLFIGFIYWVNGGFFWAIIFGFFMSLASGYLSYRYKIKRLEGKI